MIVSTVLMEMSGMMYFNMCKIMSVCTGGLFAYLISTVNVQRIKMIYSLGSKIAKPDFQP